MTTPTFDPQTLRRLHEDLGSEIDVTRDLVGTFLRSVDEMLADGRAALATGEARTVQRVAHTIKSSAATMGAMRLAELARDIEAELTAGRAPTPADVERLAAEMGRARPLIEAWRP